MAERKFSIGVDYGTNSVRALIVDVETGEEIATHVYDYPSGEFGVILDDRDVNLARQSAQDVLDGFVACVRGALDAAKSVPGFAVGRIVGLGTDTTGSSPMPVTADGTALGVLPEFKNNPHAQVWLWKDHTGHGEAAEITELARVREEPYLAKCGGTYSSEWFWSKILRCLRVAPEVFAAAGSWMELSDFVPWSITRGPGEPLAGFRRNACAAGHKAMFSAEWGGLPSEAFLGALSPALAKLRPHLYDRVATADQQAGLLNDLYAGLTGLPEGLPVAVGVMDAHAGAVASGVGHGTLVKIIGTSTCDILVHPKDEPLADVPGVCGIVDGSVIPGMIGIEAGQSGVGDIFNWFVRELCPPEFAGPDAHEKLAIAAADLKPGESGLVALDWNNGNRTILVDPRLTGLLIGQTLHTSAAEVYRALLESTAYGALVIIRRLEEYGVRVDEVVNCGGIAEKSPLTMQIYADVCNRPMKVARSGQACALGAALFGAVAGGAYRSVGEAQAAMAGVKERVYVPNPEAVAVYARLFGIYRRLHDVFGGVGTEPLGDVMKELIAIREAARKG